MYFKVSISYKTPEELNLDESQKVEVGEDKKFYKQQKDSFLVNADSVTYAEAKTIKELPDNWIDKNVKSVTPSNVGRVVFSSGENWFICGVKYDTDVTKKGKTVTVHEYVMINGDDIENALDNLIENHANSVTSYKVVSIQESKILIDRGLLTSDSVIS